MTKYIFVTGGVLSGVGKGITAASIGAILKARGLKVSVQKCDQYLNVDAGTLNPAEHGEVFVTKDGAETDLDLGHYERFLDIALTNLSSVMSGRVLQKVITDERAGKYLGKTVQIVPHVTKAMQEYIYEASHGSDVHIVEVGGTVGDIEGQSWIEAIREFGLKNGRDNCAYVHVVYIPYLGASKEFKTKPAQNALKDLRSVGIIPDVIVARSETTPTNGVKAKLSLFGAVPEEAIALLPNARSIYQVPLELEAQNMGKFIVKRLNIKDKKANLKTWQELNKKIERKNKHSVRVGIVAKYLDNEDTYFSVVEALRSAAWKHEIDLQITWISAEKIENKKVILEEVCQEVDGLLVPGGFGERGVEGKIAAAQFALKKDIPYLGLCLGLQVAAIAAVRLSGKKEANSTEFKPRTKHPVITTMKDQVGLVGTGGTMRLGDYPCDLKKDSLAAKLYKKDRVLERHRHRFEFNNKYISDLEKQGLIVSGKYRKENLVEIIESSRHPFFIAAQFHPEFTSRPGRPQPLFDGFINSLKNKH